MLNEQIEAIKTLLSTKDLRQYMGEEFLNFIWAVITKDPIAGLSSIKNAKDLVFHMPTILFWDKMQRYLFGTFKNFSEQVRMAEKFTKDNNEYTEFVKRQIHIINELDDDIKVDYFASLTRAFLLTPLEQNLFFKLAKFLSMCTVAELNYLKNYKEQSQNNAIISSLCQYGLLMPDNNSGTERKYVLSSYGEALKQNCINFDDGINGEKYLASYNDLSPVNMIPEPLTWGNMDKMLEDSSIVLNGGDSNKRNY